MYQNLQCILIVNRTKVNMNLNNNLFLWHLNNDVDVRGDINEPVIKISNIGNHLYFLTKNHNLYHGIVQICDSVSYVDLELYKVYKLVDIDCCNIDLYIVNIEGEVFKCNEYLEILGEIHLAEDYFCSKGHRSANYRTKVQKIAVSSYGQLFITEFGHLWASGNMPQIGVNTEAPRRVNFFMGRLVHNINIGEDFAVATIVKQEHLGRDSDDEDEVSTNCPQCLSISQLASPASQTSFSQTCALEIRMQGSYDIETTSTSSKNDSSIGSENSKNNSDLLSNDDNREKNIIFRNTEAARDFLTKQFSKMSSAGEEYLVECTEKPTRILKENMTNVASFVKKTVGDKVATLSRHVSGSSDCNSVVENIDLQMERSNSKDEFMWSLSQCSSEKDFPRVDFNNDVQSLVKVGAALLNCEVWTWGNIMHGQLGVGDNVKRERPMIISKLTNIGIQKVCVQSFHTSALTLDGRLYIWGRNDCNQVTFESEIDQSSPKLYVTEGNVRIKDIACGHNFTSLLNSRNEVIYFGKNSNKQIKLYSNKSFITEQNSSVPLFNNLLSSLRFSLLNVNHLVNESLLSFLEIEQIFLEEMLTMQANLIKPLQKKSTNYSFPYLVENICLTYTSILNILAADVYSLLECSNHLISLCDIVLLKHVEEIVYIHKKYGNFINNIVSVDGFKEMCKLIEIPQSLYKLRDDVLIKKEKNDFELLRSLLLGPLNNLLKCLSFVKELNEHENVSQKLEQFIEEQKTKFEDAEQTRQFWLSSNKIISTLKIPTRRVIRDSRKYPITLQGATRFTSHWFILFNDIFVHVIGSTPNVFDLSIIWLEPQQDEATLQYQITMKMPEDTIVLSSPNPESKIEWFHAMQTAIKNALNKPQELQPSTIRSATFKFVKNGFFKDATYSGRWANGRMQGIGRLEWQDGKTYTGQFSNSQLCGYGCMDIPNIGIYEGQWKDNTQNGFGLFTYTNRDVYKGYFKDGVPHGHGSLKAGSFTANTASVYIGDWAVGFKCGYGVLDNIVTGEKYMGIWNDDKKQGNGLIITSDGKYYEGNFHQDVLTGTGIMSLEDRTYFEGEFKGTGILNGKGSITLPTGQIIDGNFTGSFSDNIRISNGTLTLDAKKDLLRPFEKFCAPSSLKWKALFKHFHQNLGIPETLNKNGTKHNSDTQKIWQNIAVLSNKNVTLSKFKKDKAMYNKLDNLDIIPPFGRDKMDLNIFLEVKQYLTKAFENKYHPLGDLLNSITEAYNTTYGGRAHPLLLTHAISELHHITRRLYVIIEFLFPALPDIDKETVVEIDSREESLSYQALLYPFILPKVHHPLFILFTLKNETLEAKYKNTLKNWNKQADATLMSFLSIDQKFMKLSNNVNENSKKHYVFLTAIETLQQLKSTFSPAEKLLVIKQTIEKMTGEVQNLLGVTYTWSMDDLFTLFLYVVVRARISDLGAEIDIIENFMDPSLENGELGIMFTTLKACYYQIIREEASI